MNKTQRIWHQGRLIEIVDVTDYEALSKKPIVSTAVLRHGIAFTQFTHGDAETFWDYNKEKPYTITRAFFVDPVTRERIIIWEETEKNKL